MIFFIHQASNWLAWPAHHIPIWLAWPYVCHTFQALNLLTCSIIWASIAALYGAIHDMELPCLNNTWLSQTTWGLWIFDYVACNSLLLALTKNLKAEKEIEMGKPRKPSLGKDQDEIMRGSDTHKWSHQKQICNA